jgi:hypothetical protein
MDWINSADLAKFTQSNLKNWVESDNWVDMNFKNENHKKNNLDSSLLNPNPKISRFIQSVKYSNVVTNDYFIGSNSKYSMIWVLILAKLNQTHVHPLGML